MGNILEIDYLVQLGLHESDNKPAEGALYLLRISLENSLNIKNRCPPASAAGYLSWAPSLMGRMKDNPPEPQAVPVIYLSCTKVHYR